MPRSLAMLTIEKRGDGKRQRGGWRPEVGATSSMADPGNTVVCLRQPTAATPSSVAQRRRQCRPAPPTTAIATLPHCRHRPSSPIAPPPLVHLQISLPLSYLKVVVVVVRRMPIEGHRRCSRPPGQVMGGGHRRACRLCHRCPPPPATLNTPPPPRVPQREMREDGSSSAVLPGPWRPRKDQSPHPCFAR